MMSAMFRVEARWKVPFGKLVAMRNGRPFLSASVRPFAFRRMDRVVW
jgi:hypothetical protein